MTVKLFGDLLSMSKDFYYLISAFTSYLLVSIKIYQTLKTVFDNILNILYSFSAKKIHYYYILNHLKKSAKILCYMSHFHLLSQCWNIVLKDHNN